MYSPSSGQTLPQVRGSLHSTTNYLLTLSQFPAWSSCWSRFSLKRPLIKSLANRQQAEPMTFMLAISRVSALGKFSGSNLQGCSTRLQSSTFMITTNTIRHFYCELSTLKQPKTSDKLICSNSCATQKPGLGKLPFLHRQVMSPMKGNSRWVRVVASSPTSPVSMIHMIESIWVFLTLGDFSILKSKSRSFFSRMIAKKSWCDSINQFFKPLIWVSKLSLKNLSDCILLKLDIVRAYFLSKKLKKTQRNTFLNRL